MRKMFHKFIQAVENGPAKSLRHLPQLSGFSFPAISAPPRQIVKGQRHRVNEVRNEGFKGGLPLRHCRPVYLLGSRQRLTWGCVPEPALPFPNAPTEIPAETAPQAKKPKAAKEPVVQITMGEVPMLGDSDPIPSSMENACVLVFDEWRHLV